MSTGTPFDVDVNDEGGTVVITVSGELDLATAPELREACGSAAQGSAETVRIDLSGLTFLDSSGISVLVETQRDLEERGATLVLHNMNDRTRRVLDVAGLSGFFTHSDQPTA